MRSGEKSVYWLFGTGALLIEVIGVWLLIYLMEPETFIHMAATIGAFF